MEDRGCGLSEISASTGQCPAQAQPREPELRPAPGGRYTLTPAASQSQDAATINHGSQPQTVQYTPCPLYTLYTCTVEVGCHNSGPGQLV